MLKPPLVAALAAIGLSASAPASQVVVDLPYGPKPYQLFDWYPPKSTGGQAPSHTPWVVYVHGSGGDKTDVAVQGQVQLLDLLRENGFSVFAFNWANYGAAIYPVQLFDARDAIQYLRHNAQGFDIDPERMVLWGHSAGATIAGWIAYGPDLSDPQGTQQQQQSTRPLAFLNWRGLTNFTIMDPLFPATPFGAPNLGSLPLPFLKSVSPSELVVDVQRAYTPPVASYYDDVATPPPLNNPHDATFMADLHAKLQVADPAAAAQSVEITNPNWPHIDIELLEEMAFWALTRVGPPRPLNVGSAKAGSTGFPYLIGDGDFSPGKLVSIEMQASVPAPVWVLLMVGTQSDKLSFFGGYVPFDPKLIALLPTGPSGHLSLPWAMPPSASGQLYAQFWHADPGSASGAAASNAIKIYFGG